MLKIEFIANSLMKLHIESLEEKSNFNEKPDILLDEFSLLTSETCRESAFKEIFLKELKRAYEDFVCAYEDYRYYTQAYPLRYTTSEERDTESKFLIAARIYNKVWDKIVPFSTFEERDGCISKVAEEWCKGGRIYENKD